MRWKLAGLESRRDAMKVARHFSAGMMQGKSVMSPVGTTEMESFLCSVVPTGLIRMFAMHSRH